MDSKVLLIFAIILLNGIVMSLPTTSNNDEERTNNREIDEDRNVEIEKNVDERAPRPPRGPPRVIGNTKCSPSPWHPRGREGRPPPQVTGIENENVDERAPKTKCATSSWHPPGR